MDNLRRKKHGKIRANLCKSVAKKDSTMSITRIGETQAKPELTEATSTGVALSLSRWM
jgi:hypothetical protein